MKKILKGKHYYSVEEVQQKMSEALKGIKINKFKKCFEQWKMVSIGLLHQMESTLKVTEVSMCKNKYINFYNFGGGQFSSYVMPSSSQ